MIANITSSGIDGGNLSITTGSLSYSDILDKEQVRSTGLGLNLSYNATDNVNVGTASNSSGINPIDGFSLSLANRGSVKDQINRATIGQGVLNVSNAIPDYDPAFINRDIDKSQEIIEDKVTGALAGELNVDTRLLSEDGREDIVNDFAATRDGALDLKNNTGYLLDQLNAKTKEEKVLSKRERQTYNILRKEYHTPESAKMNTKMARRNTEEGSVEVACPACIPLFLAGATGIFSMKGEGNPIKGAIETYDDSKFIVKSIPSLIIDEELRRNILLESKERAYNLKNNYDYNIGIQGNLLSIGGSYGTDNKSILFHANPTIGIDFYINAVPKTKTPISSVIYGNIGNLRIPAASTIVTSSGEPGFGLSFGLNYILFPTPINTSAIIPNDVLQNDKN